MPFRSLYNNHPNLVYIRLVYTPVLANKGSLAETWKTCNLNQNLVCFTSHGRASINYVMYVVLVVVSVKKLQ